MENQVLEPEAPVVEYQQFGDQFAYAAVTATIMCTFSIINVIGYIA
jgi:hypothetical protein